MCQFYRIVGRFNYAAIESNITNIKIKFVDEFDASTNFQK